MSSNLRYLGLPRPHNDELLSSLIARSAVALAQGSPKGLNAQIFKSRQVVVSPDLQASLELLTDYAQEVWGLDVEDVISHHTLANYYCHYLNDTVAQYTRQGLLGKKSNLHVRLGICASSVVAPKFFQMCKKCVASDLQQYGYTFFRRSHHLPGVLVCAKHAVSLTQTRTPFRPLTRHEHVLPHRCMLDGATDFDIDTKHLNALVALARRSEEILTAVSKQSCSEVDYKLELKSRFSGNLAATHQQAALQLMSIFGEKNLALMFKGNRQSESLWIKEVLRGSRRALHPLKHLLLEYLLSETDVIRQTADLSQDKLNASALQNPKTWGVYRNTDLRQLATELKSKGLAVRAIAREMSVDSKTVNRLLAPLPSEVQPIAKKVTAIEKDKVEWLSLVAENPTLGKKSVRKLAPALYARLYRADRVWLLASMEDKAPPTPLRPARVNWSERDTELAKEIEELVKGVKALRPFVRASKNYILGQLNCKPLVENFSHNLPFVCSALNFHCESVYQFHVRRLSEILAAQDMSMSCAFRIARINQYRYPDGGVELFHKVRLGLSLELTPAG